MTVLIREEALPARGHSRTEPSGHACPQTTDKPPRGGYSIPKWTLVADETRPYPQDAAVPGNPQQVSLGVGSALCTAKCPLSLMSTCC